MSLPGVTDATYTLTVANHHGDTVIARQLTASVYGDGAGLARNKGPAHAVGAVLEQFDMPRDRGCRSAARNVDGGLCRLIDEKGFWRR